MKISRSVHPDFQFFLNYKEKEMVELYYDLRKFILKLFPDCNELVYNTHVLTSVYSTSDKLSDAFCHTPIYSQHINLGFNKGTLLDDNKGLLKGTGNLIRHISVTKQSDYKNSNVEELLNQAFQIALNDMSKAPKFTGQTISKIKKPL